MAALFALVLVSCDPEGKEDIKKTPVSQAKVSVTPLTTYNYIDYGAPKVYRGDTVRYAVNVSVPEGIKEIKVMELVNDVPAAHGYFTPITSFVNSTTHDFEFKFVAPDTVTRKFFIQVTETNEATNDKNINTTGNPVISISPKEAEGYIDLKLFNSIGLNANGFLLRKQDFKLFPQQAFFIMDSYFLYNHTNIDNPNNLSFVRGWMATKENGSEYVIADSIDFDNCTPNDIQRSFSKGQDQSSNIISDVKTGSVYVAKIYNDKSVAVPNGFREFTYGVIRITNIADDLKTANEGGSDDDYIQFDFKTFNNFRFQQ